MPHVLFDNQALNDFQMTLAAEQADRSDKASSSTRIYDVDYCQTAYDIMAYFKQEAVKARNFAGARHIDIELKRLEKLSGLQLEGNPKSGREEYLKILNENKGKGGLLRLHLSLLTNTQPKVIPASW